MKSKIVLGSVFSAVMAVGVSAQTTPPQTGSQDSQSNRQVTFTGCLQSAEATRASGASGTTGSSSSGTGTTGAGAASAGSAFVLMNAKMGSGSGTASSGSGSTGSTASGSSSPSSSAAMARIKLEGSQSDLQKYANSQVEVRGTLDSKMSGSSGSTTGSAAAGSATGSSATGSTASGSTATGSTAGATGSTSGQDMATLRVTSVRQIASSCSGS